MKLDELTTITDALEQLKKETGVAWTERTFLSAVYKIGIELQAQPPVTAGVSVNIGNEMDVNGTPRSVVRNQWRMALLKSTDIKQLLLFGEAIVHEAVKEENIHDEDYIQSLVEISEYFTSPVQVSCEMVRVPVGVIEKIISSPEIWPTASAEKLESLKGITKQQVINAFEDIHFDRNGWNNALSDVPKWIEPCRVTPGRKGDNSTSATWNPVLIAAALLDKNIPIKKIDVVFLRLKDWRDEWKEISESSRD